MVSKCFLVDESITRHLKGIRYCTVENCTSSSPVTTPSNWGVQKKTTKNPHLSGMCSRKYLSTAIASRDSTEASVSTSTMQLKNRQS